MKEQMRKISLLVFYKEKEQILNMLQDLGVMHLVTAEAANETIDRLTEEKTKYQKALVAINNSLNTKTEIPGKYDINENLAVKRDEIIALQDKIEHAAQQIEHYKKDISILEPWGDFDWDNVKKLKTHGLYITFYSADRKEFQGYDFRDINYFIISESKAVVHFVVVGEQNHEIPFDPIHLPQHSISDLENLRQNEEKTIEDCQLSLVAYSSLIPNFEEEIAVLDDKLAYEKANSSFSTHAEGKIQHIQGWIPLKIEKEIRKYLDDNDVSYIIESPNPKDQIPIILKNRKYSKRFEPITKMFQLPNFYEFDLTPVVAVFYPIFFAYCLGDSGYGLVLLLLGILARFTFLKKTRIVADLIIILGIVATILGIIKAGTLFGLPIANHQDIPLFNWLSSYIVIPDDTNVVFNTFNVALMMGIFQILVGVCIAIYRKIKYQSFIYSIATFGKLFIIIGAIVLFLGGMQEVEVFIPYLPFAWTSMIGGIFLVLAFHDPDTSILKRIGGGFLPVYFIFTGLLGDILSYIRLFALGVASSILGIVVNDIGHQILSDGGLGWIVLGVVFLLFGHSLNLAIAALGSFVHPLRLTFVEFYNNAEFKGGGIEFKPFRKHIINLIASKS